jgi:hypothetical protein
MTESTPQIGIRHTQPRDFAGIVELCQRVYPDTPPWRPAQPCSHLHVFPEGQFVAVIGPEEWVVGMAACCASWTGAATACWTAGNLHRRWHVHQS